MNICGSIINYETDDILYESACQCIYENNIPKFMDLLETFLPIFKHFESISYKSLITFIIFSKRLSSEAKLVIVEKLVKKYKFDFDSTKKVVLKLMDYCINKKYHDILKILIQYKKIIIPNDFIIKNKDDLCKIKKVVGLGYSICYTDLLKLYICLDKNIDYELLSIICNPEDYFYVFNKFMDQIKLSEEQKSFNKYLYQIYKKHLQNFICNDINTIICQYLNDYITYHETSAFPRHPTYSVLDDNGYIMHHISEKLCEIEKRFYMTHYINYNMTKQNISPQKIHNNDFNHPSKINYKYSQKYKVKKYYKNFR